MTEAKIVFNKNTVRLPSLQPSIIFTAFPIGQEVVGTARTGQVTVLRIDKYSPTDL